MIEGYSLRKSAELLEVHYVTLFYWRYKLLSAIKEIDFDQFEGIGKWTRLISYTQKRENAKWEVEKLVNAVVRLHNEASAKNKSVSLSQETVRK